MNDTLRRPSGIGDPDPRGQTGKPAAESAAQTRGSLWTTGLVFALALVISASFNGRPALWLDEVATLSAASRPLSELWAMLGHVDLVHAFYYLLMHPWVGLVGNSPFWMRFPSAVFVALGVAFTHRVALRFTSRGAALAIALVAACLPRVAWAGSEAREAGLTLCLAMFATWLLLRARGASRPLGWWIGYVFVGLAGVAAHMFWIFMPLAHLVWAFTQRRRTSWLPTAVAAAAVAMPSAVFAAIAREQAAQVSWISDRSLTGTLVQLAVKQFTYGDDKPSGFHHGVPVLAAIGLLAVCFAFLIVRLIARRATLDAADRSLALLATCGLVVPLVSLLAANWLVAPVYVPRYLTYSACFLAVLLVQGARVGVRGRERTAARTALVLVCLLGLALQAPMRQLVDAPSDDYRTVAREVADAHVDAFITTETWIQGVTLAEPAAFQDLENLALDQTASEADLLYPTLRQPQSVADAATGRVAVLAAGSSKDLDARAWYQALEQVGCQRESEQPGRVITVSVWSCP